MRIRWRNFELPSSVKVDKDVLTDVYGKFYIEPFERGFGHSIGNGYAVYSFHLLKDSQSPR